MNKDEEKAVGAEGTKKQQVVRYAQNSQNASKLLSDLPLETLVQIKSLKDYSINIENEEKRSCNCK